jgi:macrolide-specific efflux system membrane fusion protein
VTVSVTGKPSGLYAGSTASLAITVKQATDVLAVSTQALHTEGEETFVYVVDGSQRTKRVVTVGTTYGADTEILSGLDEGEVVEVVSFSAPRGGGNNRDGGSNELRIPEGGFGGNGPGGDQGPVIIEQGG